MFLPLILAATVWTPAPQERADSLRSPFQGFETHILQNGVRLWYQRLEGAPNVSVSVSLPFGSDQDPVGKEESAHFLEHMLFSDHRGRTEEEVKEEIEGRGGVRNGLTYPDRTFYYVTIGREHGLFAVRWLGWLVEPHDMAPEVVERNRRPVAVEIQARPRELTDWLGVLLNPSWLRPEGYWEREFGLSTRNDRVYDRWATLNALRGEDLRAFYDRYYVPDAMTVTVVGDLPRDSVLAVAREAFGGLGERPVPPAYGEPEDPGRFRKSVSWGFRANPGYRTRFKVFEPTGGDLLTLYYIRDLLARRLDRKLRYGEEKAVYGMAVSVVTRGPVAYLAVEGTVAKDAYARARVVVDEELELLRTGSYGPDEFQEDRSALVERLRATNRTAQDLNFQVRLRFYQRDLWQDFPDLVAIYEAMTPERLASFAGEHFVQEARLEYLDRKQPVGQGLLFLGILAVLWAGVRLARTVLISPVDMREIRYVARIKLSLPVLVVWGILFAGVGLLLLRLWIFVLERLAFHWVLPVDLYAVQMAAFAGMGVLTLALILAWLSLVPRKILVFPDHIRVKYLSYRSRAVRPEDVAELSLRRFPAVWLSSALLRVTPLATGLFSPGVLLRLKGRRGLFFRARKGEELLEAMAVTLEEPPGNEEVQEPVATGS